MRDSLRRRADFEQAYEAGARMTGRFMTMFVRHNACQRPRLGIAATRKIGSAVVRNRAKRRARELFRHYKPTTGFDIVIVPRREFLDAPYASLEHEFSALLVRGIRAGGRSAGSRRPSRPRADSRV